MTGPRILLLDIETSPHLCYSFNTYKALILPEHVKEPSRVLCWAAKWDQDPRVLFKSEYHHDYMSMLVGIRDLLDECDVAVAYNGDKFDLPRLRQQFRLNGIEYPSPFIQVDLYKVLKKHEIWPFHKLGYVTEQLGMTGKVAHEGFLLWRKVLGDYGEDEQRRAWARMRRYCKGDVVTMQEVFEEYGHLVTNIPAAGLYADEVEVLEIPPCPRCSSTNIQRRGYERTKVRRYARFQCQDCGRWYKQTRSEMGVAAS